MDARPPAPLPPGDAKRETPSSTGHAAGTLRDNGKGTSSMPRYPKPPGLVVRMVMLCLRPETWPEMARYPTRFTLVPLFLAVMIGAVAVGVGEGSRLHAGLEQFASTYNYPPMEFDSNGVLSVKGELPEPIRFEHGELRVLVDPTGKTAPESVKSSNTLLLTDRQVVASEAMGGWRRELKDMFNFQLPPAGVPQVIDVAFVRKYTDGMAVGIGVMVAVVHFLSDALWAAAMMFLVSPMVLLAAAGPRLNAEGPDRRLILPRRATYRITGALLVPLILLGAALHAFGHPVYAAVGGQGAMLFWFFSSAAVAFWAGLMARRMYGPGNPKRRAT